jgi:hypothetical protein
MNQSHTRNIVQIYNEREDHLFTTVLAIANYRLRPQDSATAFKFWETPQGNPPALRAWFFPGDTMGQEFVYPKGLAAIIAKETHEPVLSTPAETVAELATAPVTTVEETGVEKPVEEAVVAPAPAPAEAPVLVAKAEPEPAPQPLPETASPYFTIGLAGLASLAAGLGLRRTIFTKS